MPRPRLVIAALIVSAACATSNTVTTSSGSPVIQDSTPQSGVPDCLLRFVEEERSASAPLAASLSPLTGGVGTKLSISGEGMPTDARLAVFAFYNAEGCELPGAGLADHVLGEGQSDSSGAYEVSLAWTKKFNPATGRGLHPDGYTLPLGDYFILVVPCHGAVADCLGQLNLGSALGPVFTVDS